LLGRLGERKADRFGRHGRRPTDPAKAHPFDSRNRSFRETQQRSVAMLASPDKLGIIYPFCSPKGAHSEGAMLPCRVDDVTSRKNELAPDAEARADRARTPCCRPHLADSAILDHRNVL
jgi:hypothetical protein